jgi:type II secretory pathway component PulF
MRRALAIAEHTAQEPVLTTLRSVRARVEQGESLADALGAHSDLFPPMYVGLVRAGERSADVANSFTRLAGHLERDEEFRSRIVSASIYPSLLALIGGAAMLLLLFFVLPRFAELLESAGATMPRSTSIMLWIGEHAKTGWPVALTGGIALLGIIVWQQTSESGKRSLSRLLLRLPFTAGFRRDALSARFARVLGVLMGGGTPVVAALEAAEHSIPDPLTRDEIAAIRKRVQEGSSLHSAAVASGLFSPVVTELIAVGEESSRIDAMLTKSAEILERQVERSLQRLTSIAEPALIVIFGVVIGFVALSLLQAVYGMNMELTP